MATTAPMFLELEQEECERELEEADRLMVGDTSSESLSQQHDEGESRKEYELLGKRTLFAAEKGRLVELVRHIHQDPTLVNFADSDGYTPLHRASYSGNIDCVKYLVRHGASLEAKTSDDWRPLHCAVRWNNLDIAEYLLKQGADVNAKSSGGNTPLHIVASNGRYAITCDIVQLLLFHTNCDYTIKNHSGDTAYDIAKRSGPFYRFWNGVMTIVKDGQDLKD